MGSAMLVKAGWWEPLSAPLALSGAKAKEASVELHPSAVISHTALK